MARYDYRCENCDTTFEVQHSIHEDALTTHEACGGPLRRLIGNPSVHFAGGRNFFSTTTIREAQQQQINDIKATGGNPEPVGTRWV